MQIGRLPIAKEAISYIQSEIKCRCLTVNDNTVGLSALYLASEVPVHLSLCTSYGIADLQFPEIS